MKYLYSILFILSIVISLVKAGDSGNTTNAPATLIGCFSGVNAKVQNTGQYQTASSCSEACPKAKFVAVKGVQCFCLDSLPVKQVSSDQCSTPCPGYGKDTCGGNSAYSIFQGQKYDGSADDIISSAAISSASSSATDMPNSSSNSLVTSTSSGSVIVETVTENASPTETSSHTTETDSDGNKNSNKKDSKTNVGAIAGGVVGGVVAAILIGVLIYFWVKKRNDDEYDEEEFYDNKPMSRHNGSTRGTRKNKNVSPLDMPMSNPFVDPGSDKSQDANFADPRVNPIMMGRRRLSEGSLVDAVDYSRKVLQVANPDS